MGPRKMGCDSGPPKDAFTLVDISFQRTLDGIYLIFLLNNYLNKYNYLVMDFQSLGTLFLKVSHLDIRNINL
jgi:hypothetical protein